MGGGASQPPLTPQPPTLPLPRASICSLPPQSPRTGSVRHPAPHLISPSPHRTAYPCAVCCAPPSASRRCVPRRLRRRLWPLRHQRACEAQVFLTQAAREFHLGAVCHRKAHVGGAKGCRAVCFAASPNVQNCRVSCPSCGNRDTRPPCAAPASGEHGIGAGRDWGRGSEPRGAPWRGARRRATPARATAHHGRSNAQAPRARATNAIAHWRSASYAGVGS